MSTSLIPVRNRFARTATTLALCVGALVALSPMVSGAADAAPVITTGVHSSTAGDGVWAPSHDEETALIPVCSGPTATLRWLYTNFSDHGNDLGQFLRMHSSHIEAILDGDATGAQALLYLAMPFAQIPVYAVNDTVFHQTATIGDILSFCSSARS